MEIKNPAFNYDKFGTGYSSQRQTDPRIAAAYVYEALAGANTILNVGAGAGSYEPVDKYVVAVEPSATMRAQRQANNKVPAIIGKAGDLPFDDDSFDAAMAMVTIHHWPDMRKGLQELRRVARNQVLIMTFDPDQLDNFWNSVYFPEVIAAEKARYPKNDFVVECLGGDCDIKPIPVPLDCLDGFQEAFYGRPEAFLDPKVRFSQSAWSFVPEEVQQIGLEKLADDLQSGEWDKKYGHLRKQLEFTCALRLIVSRK